MALNILSLLLLVAAALAFTRQERAVLYACGALFVPAAGGAAVLIFWEWNAAFTGALLAFTLGVSLLLLLLYWVDRTFAVFCLQMTYPAMLMWLLWPALVVVNIFGLAIMTVF
jgi:hypothetical protein